jgi:putative hydrolase of HD superfamily
MNMDILAASDKEILEEIRRIREMYTLKHTMRYESARDHEVHSESVAEHIYGMFVLADYFLPLEDPERKLDRSKLHRLVLYHELGEIELGDTMFHKKSDANTRAEAEAAKVVAVRMPEHVRAPALASFEEFEAGTSPEARFAVALDKLEPIFELSTDIGSALYRQHGMNKEVAIGKKYVVSEGYPYLRRFLDAWLNWMVSINAFAE